MKEQSPVGRIWELGKKEHGKLITAVVLAVIGVACGMVPYFAAAKIIMLLLAGRAHSQRICRGFWAHSSAILSARYFTTAHWVFPTRQHSTFSRLSVRSFLRSCRDFLSER